MEFYRQDILVIVQNLFDKICLWKLIFEIFTTFKDGLFE